MMANPYRGWNYEDYLTTAHWQETRKRKLMAVGHKCQRCNRYHALEVHHLTYERLGEERMEDLEVLCPICHRKAHGIEPNAEDWRRARWVYGHETLNIQRKPKSGNTVVADDGAAPAKGDGETA